MLTYFRAENYRCLERVEFPLTPVHVLIGPNDSGKTSVLEAMQTFMQSTSSNVKLRDTLREGWKGRELLFHGAPDSAQVILTAMGDRELAPREATAGPARWDHLGFSFSIAFGPEGCHVPREGTVARRDSNNEESGQSWGGERDPLTQKTAPAILRATGADPEVRLLLPRGLLGPSSFYRFDPTLLAAPAMAKPERKFRMDSDGFGLATLLDDILGYDPQLFLDVRKSFCGLFPQFKSMRLETSEAYDREYRARGEYSPLIKSGAGKVVMFETQWGRDVSARQASEGVLLFLAFLALVHLPLPHRPKLLLLEEPERGVYPKKLDELIQALKKWVEGAGDKATQIVMATHSPYVISLFQPEEVTFLSRAKSGGVRARPLRFAPRIHERLGSEFYLGELWYNYTEEELFGDAQ